MTRYASMFLLLENDVMYVGASLCSISLTLSQQRHRRRWIRCASSASCEFSFLFVIRALLSAFSLPCLLSLPVFSLFTLSSLSPITLWFALYCSQNENSNAPNYGDHTKQFCALEFLNWVMTTITTSLNSMHLGVVASV